MPDCPRSDHLSAAWRASLRLRFADEVRAGDAWPALARDFLAAGDVAS